MRNRMLPAIPAALLILLGTAAPAFAGGGLPVLSTLKAGHAEVTIYGDSLFVHTGTNTLTLEVTELPAGVTPGLRLTGPDGQVILVELSPLHVVEGPAESHGSGGEGHGDEHGGGHGAAPAADATWFRGKAAVPATGLWKAQLEISGAIATDEIKVVTNGPSPFYLAVTGVAMGGTILYGAVQRRKERRA
ncbi:MAG TPA: hypothetical protein VNT01_13305 [Symbiobacteriaceae bacterium]|nr:hypothetical protein [Symbiobacteriaceae bacterium]